MNERIKELGKQAKLELEKDIKDGKKDWKNTPQSYDEMVQERFAELIVRECMSYMKDGDVDFAKFMIKRNFGVEE